MLTTWPLLGFNKNRHLCRSCTLGQHKGFEILVLHQPTCNQRCENDRIDILYKTGRELQTDLTYLASLLKTLSTVVQFWTPR